ncbi:unnamed protein product [Euphydryas editha]|uniref:DUF7869 domain-containing protein n=1 Tax=Euphydryas editha TaxID=104508 RepID=A0AAU9UMH4_EUPED|nr:unnamed protein product [Euphydryas editha]
MATWRKGLRAKRILKMVDEWEGEDEHNNLERTDILRRDDKAAIDLKNKPTTSYTGKGDTKREPSLDIFELGTVNLNLKNSTEKDSPSSSGRNDYNIDIINERVIRTPSSVMNFSHILDNIDFIASPDGYIIHAKVERNLDETLKPIENNEDIIIKSPCKFVEDSTIIAESRVDESNDNINLRKTLTPQDRSILSPNDMVIFTNRDESPTKSDLFENYDSEKMKILVTCEPESRTLSTISVSGSLPSKSIESIDDDYGSLCINNLKRKRRRNKKDWIANKSKTLKNSGQAYVGYHSKKQYPAKSVGSSCKCKLKCGETFSFEIRNDIMRTFYKLGNRELQWQYIIKYVTSESVKKLQVIRNKNRTQTIRYYLPLEDDKVRVCKVFFLNTLQISEQTVYTAIEKNDSDLDKMDNRGKHNNRPHKMSVPTEESIVSHIKLFPSKEAHYVRKSSKRKYLCETLNISKMYRLYTDWFKKQTDGRYSDDQMATKRQYETIFNTKFNYSFFNPKKDLCGTCTLYEQLEGENKESLKDKYMKHISNKERIREIKNSEKEHFGDNSTLAIFDLEKVFGVPQSEVEIFNYKRKYPVYNFTVFDSSRKKGYCYMWHAQIAKRGSIEIGSCLYNFIEEQYNKKINKISFYSDGCAGQNKNRFVFALYLFAATKFKLEITHSFFEPGHSQNEGDSMHACIERALKNKQIYTPDQLYGLVMNAKQTGEKYKLKEMRQTDFYNIKDLITGQNWLNDTKGKRIYWSKIKQIKVTYTNPHSLYYKYEYDEDFSEMITASTSTENTRKRKSTTNATTSSVTDVILKPAYNGPVPISKALHEDLLSLCRINAIPHNYHSFYNSLISTITETVTDEDDSENE